MHRILFVTPKRPEAVIPLTPRNSPDQKPTHVLSGLVSTKPNQCSDLGWRGLDAAPPGRGVAA